MGTGLEGVVGNRLVRKLGSPAAMCRSRSAFGTVPYKSKLISWFEVHTPVSTTVPFGILWAKVPAALTDFVCGLNVPAPVIS